MLRIRVSDYFDFFHFKIGFELVEAKKVTGKVFRSSYPIRQRYSHVDHAFRQISLYIIFELFHV